MVGRERPPAALRNIDSFIGASRTLCLAPPPEVKAYGRVSPARRAALHQQIGQHLECGHGAAATQITSELALHFERARDPRRAVLHLERAGRNALRRGAHQEAIRHLTHALALVESMDDTPERARRLLALHLALGPAWMAAAGYAAGEVGATYERALDLAERPARSARGR